MSTGTVVEERRGDSCLLRSSLVSSDQHLEKAVMLYGIASHYPASLVKGYRYG